MSVLRETSVKEVVAMATATAITLGPLVPFAL